MNNISDLAEHLVQYAEYAFEYKDREDLERVLKEFFDKLNNGWIPVINDDEHYPEGFKGVLFTDGWEIYTGYCDPDYNWFATNGENTIEIEVATAWMPLPEPYKEGPHG